MMRKGDKFAFGLILSILLIMLIAQLGPSLNGWLHGVQEATVDNHKSAGRAVSSVERGGGNVKFLIYQADATNSCGRNSYVTIPKTHLTNNGIQVTEMCSGTLNAAVLANYDVVYLGRSRGRGRVVAADVRNWVQAGGGVWSESCGMVDQQDPVQGGYIALEDMFGYTNRIGRGDNAGGFSFTKVGNHEIWAGVNSPVSGSNGLFDSELRDNNIAQQATQIGNANNQQSPMINIYGRGRTYSGVGGNWNSNGNCQRYFLNVVKWLAVEITAHVDGVAIRGQGELEKVCYAEYREYNLSVNITATRDLYEVSELLVYLDYNTTNATLGYNWTRGQFFKLQDPEGHVRFIADKSSLSNDGVDRWWVNFTFMINFTFAHERMVDCFVDTTANTGETSRDRFPYLFRVENDMELVGTAGFTGEFQGELTEGDWIRGNEDIRVSDLKVRYAGSANIYPEDVFFDVRTMDSVGNTWWDNESKGENIVIDLSSRNVTDPDEEYLITIENIPGSGICMTNLTFPVKIDAEAPLYPDNLLCRAGGFKDKETGNTNQAEMYVTWDAVEDPASGLLGYYYSKTDNSGTINGTFINVTEVKIDKLDEGGAEIYVWCIDKVGNIGDGAKSGILVDLTPPVFSNHTPMDGSWHDHTDIDCSVEIYDGEGAGVDGTTIEYSVSANGENGFNFWIPAWVPEEKRLITPHIKYIFPEGEENYIKWRAKDITENGFVESSPINIKIDVTPVIFEPVITPQTEWYDHNTVSTSISVSDGGSGVDPTSLEVRISRTGPNDFCPWIRVDPENITGSGLEKYEVSVTFNYSEGKDNFIMFRGTDEVGNPPTISDKFNLKIDTSPVYFGTFTPDKEDYADSTIVECFIQIFDDGSGVDPKTVEYSVAKGVGGDEKKFGPWKKTENVVSGTPTQVLMEVEFQWGSDNYIRWRADDIMGTGFNESKPFRVWVNSKPTAEISAPEQGSFFRYGRQIFFDASESSDEDGDNLSYYWSSNVSANKSIGSKVFMSASLVPGKHTITLFVSDGHGYNESKKVKLEVLRKLDYETDSDGDGYSDGLEREKGTDPLNRALTPPGEPDIIDQESGGLLGEGSSWLFLILFGIFLLIILILLALFIVIKRKKKSEKEIPPTIQPTLQQSDFGPNQHFYPQGQYMSPGQQGYGSTPPTYGGMPGGQAAPTALPPAHGMAQFDPVQIAPQTNYGQLGPATDPLTDAAFLLPSFPTDQGLQNLELMALPPGPAPLEQDTINTGVPIQMPAPDMPFPPAFLPDIAAMEKSFLGPSQPLPSSEELLQVPPDAPAPMDVPTLAVAGPIPVDPSVPGDLSQLDAYLFSLDESHDEPSAPPPSGQAVLEENPTRVTNEITMQCHSCGNNYTAEIVQLPALVTCPVCTTQGVINSI